MNEFNQLWDEIAIMVDFEAKRIRNSSGKVDVHRIETYYKTEIIDKLWFDFIFPNKYNKWICDYYENSPAIQQEIRESMDSFSPVSRGKRSSVLFVAGVVIFVLGLLSFVLPELDGTISVCLTLVGVVLGVWGFVKRSNSGSCCEMSALTGELDRIKKQVNMIIHEHADC